ncbi:imidazole glycerol phosphate synthase subunit HisH [Acetivibrio cellulolyticus]|uniref:imidazole glycerol phosphate synthase subunit HisH n=1 Tax=Acetivibrio cellulolyticus TaxID=35830 RepID=UPI0001E2E348|nr:imidazole glycerol phosphate synthase subunit HisH [Acetivibrio cellulolyticus]
MRKVTIIDYGLCNILSVKRAFEYCGADVSVVDEPDGIFGASYLVLPGVGAFADGMEGLKSKRLIDPIMEFCLKDRPFMGICLGMQMMMEQSEEFGLHSGLGIIKGKVIRIPEMDIDGEYQKVPHIGWNTLEPPKGKNIDWWKDSILDGIQINERTYFVHSYTAWIENSENRLADTYYGGRLISAVIRKGNIYGCQFHPEKSGEVGLRIINNFLK